MKKRSIRTKDVESESDSASDGGDLAFEKATSKQKNKNKNKNKSNNSSRKSLGGNTKTLLSNFGYDEYDNEDDGKVTTSSKNKRKLKTFKKIRQTPTPLDHYCVESSGVVGTSSIDEEAASANRYSKESLDELRNAQLSKSTDIDSVHSNLSTTVLGDGISCENVLIVDEELEKLSVEMINPDVEKEEKERREHDETTKQSKLYFYHMTIPIAKQPIKKVLIGLNDSINELSNRKIEIQSKHDLVCNEYVEKKRKLHDKATIVTLVEDLKMYLIGYLNMLSEKSIMIVQLENASLQYLQDIGKFLFNERIVSQEDTFYRVYISAKQNHIFFSIDLNGYAPSKILMYKVFIQGNEIEENSKVDEFGRSINNLTHSSDIALELREKQRKKLIYCGKWEFSEKHEEKDTTHVDAFSYKEEFDATSLQFIKKSLYKATSVLFEDVKDEYMDINSTLKNIASIRDSNWQKYSSLYVSLSLPKILQPLITKELISYTFVDESFGGDEDCSLLLHPLKNFTQFKWYLLVQKFIVGGNNKMSDSKDIDNDDNTLMARIIVSCYCPWLSQLIPRIFNVLCEKSNTLICEIFKSISQVINNTPLSDARTILEKQLASLSSVVVDQYKINILLPVITINSHDINKNNNNNKTGISKNNVSLDCIESSTAAMLPILLYISNQLKTITLLLINLSNMSSCISDGENNSRNSTMITFLSDIITDPKLARCCTSLLDVLIINKGSNANSNNFYQDIIAMYIIGSKHGVIKNNNSSNREPFSVAVSELVHKQDNEREVSLRNLITSYFDF